MAANEQVRPTVQKLRSVFKDKKRAAVIGAVAGLVVTGLVLIAVLVLPNLEVNAFKRHIEAREYREADAVYDDFDSKDRTKANAWMREYIARIEQQYYAGNVDYDTSSMILQEMTQYEAANEEAAEAEGNIYLDNWSSMAFDKAKEFVEDKLWERAIQELDNIPIQYRLYNEVTALRSECVTNCRTDVLQRATAAAETGEINKVLEIRDSALLVLPDDKEIIQGCQKLLDDYVSKTLTDAAALAENADYTGAMELLQYAAGMYDHQDFWNALGSYGYEAAAAHCEALVAQGDLAGAVAYAGGLAVNDAAYDTLVDQYAPALVTQTLAAAQSYADQRQFEQAIATIVSVQSSYDCGEFYNAIENYQSYLPRKLAACHVLDNHEVEIGITATDCFGNEYESIVGWDRGFSDPVGYAVFHLEGRFFRLQGTLIAGEALDSNYSVSCNIIADGVLIYESPEITRTDAAIQIDLDITEVQQLRVEFSGYQDWLGTTSVILDTTVS